MAFAVLVNLVIVIACHSWLIPSNNKSIAETNGYAPYPVYKYSWKDYAGKKPLIANKYARAVLMLLHALFLICVQLRDVDNMLQTAKMTNERFPKLSPYDPFSCAPPPQLLENCGRPNRAARTFYTDKLDVVARMETITANVVGYERILFARPELYDLLYRQVPSSKDEGGVTITLGDNTTARGDILVGADGAHSAVRNHLYKAMDKQGLLPKSDTGAMSVAYVSMLGTTDALDPTQYPCALKEYCDINYVIGDKKTFTP
ncbi:hypothetical protein BGZ96_007956 [Linnemannia gamsii]|uniref:FAD-binding domain-containing protein n=1 Tax=Linnemannia gamsii TaxID=64522 RepID=A0ABQ7JZM4_9FUNG|nr:hypothetical protein BGZ96_007956 [Linnemannia gamsii]